MAGKTYAGIFNDQFGGMTPVGTIIRDAWVFGIIPETEDCSGWDTAQLQLLYEKTSKEWEKYGYRVQNLPEPIRKNHEKIQNAAIQRAKAAGWEPDILLQNEE